MFQNIKEYFKTRKEYRASMMELSSSVTEKLNALLDAELARTAAETQALEAVKDMNSAFSPKDISDYMEQLSEFLTKMEQPAFQESYYQNLIDSAHAKNAP